MNQLSRVVLTKFYLMDASHSCKETVKKLNSKNYKVNWENYLNEKEKGDTKGGFLELLAACNLYTTGIRLYMPETEYKVVATFLNPLHDETDLGFKKKNLHDIYIESRYINILRHDTD